MSFYNMTNETCENPQIQSPLNRASKDKFLLVLNIPYALKEQVKKDSSLDITTLQLSIFGAIVPDIAVPEVSVRFGGQNLNVSSYSRPNYPPLNINFVVDNKYENYYVLWKWLEIMNTPRESLYGGLDNKLIATETGLNTEYQTDLSILALNEYNQTEIEFFYTKAFITNLGSINYNYRDGELIECTAQFHYSQLNIKKTPSNIIPGSE
jgi:hypothetical protein